MKDAEIWDFIAQEKREAKATKVCRDRDDDGLAGPTLVWSAKGPDFLAQPCIAEQPTQLASQTAPSSGRWVPIKINLILPKRDN